VKRETEPCQPNDLLRDAARLRAEAARLRRELTTVAEVVRLERAERSRARRLRGSQHDGLQQSIVPPSIAEQTPAMQLPPRLESLVLKSGLQLGAVSDIDRALVLALAACAIEPGWPLREDEVNRRLGDWLADVGQMLHTDHVELRRWLVDTGYVARDDWGHAYVRGTAHLDRARQVLGTTDGAALASAIRSVRVAAQASRVARRRAFESRV
jgi:hypothetical protein